MKKSAERGDVFQINEKHGRAGWVGAFVMVTEAKSWGILGFVGYPEEHEHQAQCFIRLEWKEIDYVGKAQLVPREDEP